jgi:hypothetical protein
VVNFIARDNEAHRLTFEILSQKLDLFGRVRQVRATEAPSPSAVAPCYDLSNFASRRVSSLARKSTHLKHQRGMKTADSNIKRRNG